MIYIEKEKVPKRVVDKLLLKRDIVIRSLDTPCWEWKGAKKVKKVEEKYNKLMV